MWKLQISLLIFLTIFQLLNSSVEARDRFGFKGIPPFEFYHFLFVPNSGNANSISEIDITNATSPREVARHYTVPSGWSGNPSRTAVDSEGNAWIGNRDTNSLIKVGNYGGGTCVDRNGNGVIDTNYDRNGNGVIDTDEMIYDINSDECILKQVYLQGSTLYSTGNNNGVRCVCVDRKDNVYAGMYGSKKLYYVSKNGDLLKTIDLSSVGCRPYGCVVDRNDLVWISCVNEHLLVKYDPKKDSLSPYPQGVEVYGLTPTIAGDGVVFNGWTDKLVRKVSLNGNIIFSVSGPNEGRGITVDKEDNIYAVGTAGSVLRKYDKNGNFITQISTCTSPYGVGLDMRGNVWVACNGCIDGYAPNLTRISRLCLGFLHYVYSDWTGSQRKLVLECNNNAICEKGETQENCPEDCRTVVNLTSPVYPGQDVIVKVYFNDSRFNQSVDVKVDLFVGGKFWDTTLCPVNGKKWGEELNCRMEICYGNVGGKSFRIVRSEGYGRIEAVCKIPSLKAGKYNLVAIPTLYSIPIPLKQSSVEFSVKSYIHDWCENYFHVLKKIIGLLFFPTLSIYN
ncbi:MAG: hypothetical protein QW472_00810 [Candidatus Aenigmatarchaeota archaeon]